MKSEHPGQCPVAVILKEPTAWGVILYLFPLKNSKYDRHIWKEKVGYRKSSQERGD